MRCDAKTIKCIAVIIATTTETFDEQLPHGVHQDFACLGRDQVLALVKARAPGNHAFAACPKLGKSLDQFVHACKPTTFETIGE